MCFLACIALFIARVLLAVVIAVVHCMPSWTNHLAVLAVCISVPRFVTTAVVELISL